MTKTPRWRNLMVALGATDTSAQPLLRKALQLAQRFNADLRLLHVIAPGYALDDVERESNELHELVERQRRRTGVHVTTTVVSDYPVAHAIVRQALKYKPDVLIAQSRRHSKLSRFLMTQTDWELIRNCPCALWLSKSGRLPRELKVLAAIDPYHSRAKPARLDDIILRTAIAVTNGRSERVIACHAYTPPSTVVPVMTGELYGQPLSEEALRRYEAAVRRTLERRLTRYHIPSRNQLMVPGEPAAALVDTAKTHHVSVVIMGAISRSALKRIFIGNTAERVIDEVECDLLVVKPAGFRTAVPRRMTRMVPGYPGAARAARLVATPLP